MAAKLKPPNTEIDFSLSISAHQCKKMFSLQDEILLTKKLIQ